jgi:transposase
VHSRYQRWVKDLPIQDRHVVVVLEARKFFCENPGCSWRIVCERFPDVQEAYARRTLRLEQIVMAMGLLVSADSNATTASASWTPTASTATPPPPAPALPSPRTLAWALLQEPPLTEPLNILVTLAPDAATAAELARTGLTALRHQDLDGWNAWRDAVTNAFLTTLGTGPTEGHAHRIELIKRTMYGRASFQLLRNKILDHHP